MVTSGLDVNHAYGMAGYQQIFLDHAFGNFEDILTRVTLSPVMGDYLNMVNNDKPAGDVQPNENYARELMQLFSIGVWMLNPDGTQMLDATGTPIPVLRPGHDRRLRARVHRLDLSAAAGRGRSERTIRRTSWATWPASRPTTTRRPRRC